MKHHASLADIKYFRYFSGGVPHLQPSEDFVLSFGQMKRMGTTQILQVPKGVQQVWRNKLNGHPGAGVIKRCMVCKDKQNKSIAASFMGAVNPAVVQVIIRHSGHDDIQAIVARTKYSTGTGRQIEAWQDDRQRKIDLITSIRLPHVGDMMRTMKIDRAHGPVQ